MKNLFETIRHIQIFQLAFRKLYFLFPSFHEELSSKIFVGPALHPGVFWRSIGLIPLKPTMFTAASLNDV